MTSNRVREWAELLEACRNVIDWNHQIVTDGLPPRMREDLAFLQQSYEAITRPRPAASQLEQSKAGAA